MKGINIHTLLGKVVSDVDLKQGINGPHITLTVRTGNKEHRVAHAVKAFGKTAELMAEFVKKDLNICVVGKVTKFLKNDGIELNYTEVNQFQVIFDQDKREQIVDVDGNH